MDEEKSELVAKVPQVIFLFWIVKVLATTLGETAGDAVTMKGGIVHPSTTTFTSLRGKVTL